MTLPQHPDTLPHQDDQYFSTTRVAAIQSFVLRHPYTFPHYGQHISTTHVSANQSSAQRSRGSETMFHDHQSVRNLKDVQGASCQTRYPERHIEIVDDRVFIVPPCNVSSNVCTYTGGNNKRLTLTLLNQKEPPNLIRAINIEETHICRSHN